jgi:hypothetical protein
VIYFIVLSVLLQLYVLSPLCLHEQFNYLLNILFNLLTVVWVKQVVSIPLGEALLALIFGCFMYILFISCTSCYIAVPLYLIDISCIYLVYHCI